MGCGRGGSVPLPLPTHPSARSLSWGLETVPLSFFHSFSASLLLPAHTLPVTWVSRLVVI